MMHAVWKENNSEKNLSIYHKKAGLRLLSSLLHCARVGCSGDTLIFSSSFYPHFLSVGS